MLITLSFPLFIYMYLAWVYISMSVEVRGQLPGVSSILWALGVELRSLSLATSTFACRTGTILQPPLYPPQPRRAGGSTGYFRAWQTLPIEIPALFPAKLRPSFPRPITQPTLQSHYQPLWVVLFCFPFLSVRVIVSSKCSAWGRKVSDPQD